ncbi:P-II family nitrogen regulator [Citricoccus sp. NPDC079358]|uniref:P-II family nitrogen regulator n=1 Tax=Citricoccus sp. NPDC079358 TaxID=3154653 RepID=UPI00344E9460
MNLITAIIQPAKLGDVKESLAEFGLTGLTVTEVAGHGAQGGSTEYYRGTAYRVDFLPKIKVELVVDAEQLESALDAIRSAARTGEIGDGKLWVTALAHVERLRTGEKGSAAVAQVTV